MMRSEIALCPHPAHSVVLPPRYSVCSSPIRFIFLGGSGVTTDIQSSFIPARRAPPPLGPRALFRVSDERGGHARLLIDTLLRENFVGDRSRVDWQSVVVQNLAQLGAPFGAQRQPHQAQHLGIAVLFDDVDALMVIDESLEFLGERTGTEAHVSSRRPGFARELIPALLNRPVAAAISND